MQIGRGAYLMFAAVEHDGILSTISNDALEPIAELVCRDHVQVVGEIAGS